MSMTFFYKSISETMKRLTIALLLCLFSLVSFAQPRGFHPERMSDEEIFTMQAEDIAMCLNLKGESKDRFITDYAAFRKEIDLIAKDAFPPKRTDSEDEIAKALQNNFEVSGKILDIRENYFHIFSEYLKPSQIQLMYHIENESGKRMHGGPGEGPGAGPGFDGPNHPQQPHNHPMPPRQDGWGTR